MFRASFTAGVMSALLLATAGGCAGKPPVPTGEVEGVVTLDGKPLGEVDVVFLPDLSKGNRYPAAGGRTDENGQYRLKYQVPNDRDPAVPTVFAQAPVGWYTVTVTDYKMMEERRPPPGRVPERYTDPARTPLSFEVKPGRQVIALALESKQ